MAKQLSPAVVDQTLDVTAAEVRDEEALLQELAALSPITYDQRRESAAKLLGIRVATLDVEVARRRPSPQEAEGSGTTVLFTDPEPWPTAVDVAALLYDLSAFYRRYVVLPDGAADMLALWTIHTYTHEAAQTTPRIGIESPQKRCGKTTLLALMGAAVARPLPASNITPAALFRGIELWRPTMLIDEADTFLADNDELRGVLNAGHTCSQAYVIRTVGENHEPRAFHVWAPVAIALIGKLPSTLADRAIVVRMRRKLPSEHVERLRFDRLEEEAETFRRRCLRWAQDHLAQLTTCDPAMPETLNDRAADNWRPLIVIADTAGAEWPTRARQAIQVLTAQDLDDEASGVLLLEDFHQLFTVEQKDRLASADVVSALHQLEERPWSEWGRQAKPITARQVARLLAPFGIKSKNIRIVADTPKGYEREDFVDAWTRYLPLLSATAPHMSHGAGLQSVASATMSNHAPVADMGGQTMAFSAECGAVADREGKPVADGTWRNPALNNGCGAVADRNTDNEGDGVADTRPPPMLPCALCRGTDRWDDQGTSRCVACYPPLTERLVTQKVSASCISASTPA